mmetsp:Transcript_20771/g.45681  ORF Transcript_20771/g.45681 Transcript_20771/m.45681 type:complete len:214 (+) Transcript_20771:200-841(+)
MFGDNEGSDAIANHHARCVCVATHHFRHQACIGHTQIFHPMHSALWVADILLCCRPHASGTTVVPCGSDAAPHIVTDFSLGRIHCWCGGMKGIDVGRQGGSGEDAEHPPKGFHHGIHILLFRQIIGIHRRRRMRISRSQLHRTTTLWMVQDGHQLQRFRKGPVSTAFFPASPLQRQVRQESQRQPAAIVCGELRQQRSEFMDHHLGIETQFDS